MPWEILQLDPETASSRDVKRAYARQLKTTRPDQDPEGFRRLHEAYQEALARTEWQEKQGRPASLPDPDDEFAMPLSDPEPASFPERESSSADVQVATSVPVSVEALDAVFQPLETALRAGFPEVAALTRQAEQALYEHPDQVLYWSRRMALLFDQYGANRDLSLKPEAMLFELAHDSFEATFQVIARLDLLGRVAGISGLGEVLLANSGKIGTHAGGFAAMRLACADAVWCQENQQMLENFAYPLLHPAERNPVTEELDARGRLGMVLQGLPLEMKLFWRDRLTGVTQSDDWQDEASQEAIKALKSPAAARWPAFEFLRNQLPPQLQAKVPLPRHNRMEKWETSGTPRSSSSSGGSSSSSRQRVRKTRVHSSGHSFGGSVGGGGGGSGLSPRAIGMIAFWVILAILKACLLIFREN